MPELSKKKVAKKTATRSRRDTVHLTAPLDSDYLTPLSAHWINLWVAETLSTDVAISSIKTIEVKVNRRLRRSLGICRPGNALIGLNPILLVPDNNNLLEETLCHELAHMVTYFRHGRRARPHGPEWAELMYVAGFQPRAQIPSHEIAGYVPSSSVKTRSRTRYEYEHYCPACDAVMTAMRTSYRWRCAPCLNEGRSGELTVTRRRA